MNRTERGSTFRRFMADKGLKTTRQRDLILDVFFAAPGHLSVDELAALTRRVDGRVSVATVYRTVKLLVESGLADARNFGDGQTRYEATVGKQHHDHLICTGCGGISEFEDKRIEILQEAVARRHRFQVTSHKLELYGLCERCHHPAVRG